MTHKILCILKIILDIILIVGLTFVIFLEGQLTPNTIIVIFLQIAAIFDIACFWNRIS